MKLALLLGCACVASDPSTYPTRIGDGRSPMSGGVNCHAMAGGLFGCTEWDGHHVLYIGENGPALVGGPAILSDLGASWGTRGPWHEVTPAQAAIWCEDSCMPNGGTSRLWKGRESAAARSPK